MVDMNIAGRHSEWSWIYTGAVFFIIPESTHKAHFCDVKLRPSSILLKIYTNERVNVLGQQHVHVIYGDQLAPLVLMVVDGNGLSLLGRNWLRHICLHWKCIHAIAKTNKSASSDELMVKYAALFKNELG